MTTVAEATLAAETMNQLIELSAVQAHLSTLYSLNIQFQIQIRAGQIFGYLVVRSF